jgi:allantoinase
VRDGRIAAVAEAGSLTGASLIDAGDALVLPGVVDVHVHTGSEPSEGIEHATAAAAAGGVTSIVDMPFDASGPVVTEDDVLRKAEAVSTAALVDVALYGTVAADGDVSRIESMAAAGVAAFKLSTYRTHPQRFPRSSDLTILHAMREIRNAGSLVAVHCENDEIVAGLIAEFSGSERPPTPSSHSSSRPPVAENHAVAGILELAYATGVAAHICHVSTGHSRPARTTCCSTRPSSSGRADARRSTRRCARGPRSMRSGRRWWQGVSTSSHPTTSAGGSPGRRIPTSLLSQRDPPRSN